MTYQGGRGMVPNRLTNPNYGWEVNRKGEVALETGLAKNRVMTSVAYFRNRSSNQLVQFPLPTTTGFGSVVQNMPATVQNTGWELEVSTQNITHGKFSWTTSLNITIPRNVLVEYEGIENSPYANRYEVGKSLSTIKRYQYTGLDPETGMYRFADLDENGRINFPGDLVAAKESGQRYYGGLHNRLAFGNVSLTFFIQFINQAASDVYEGFSLLPGGIENQPASVLNRWQKPGDQTDVQRFVFFNQPAFEAYDAFTSSDGRITDASFIRLKNVSLAYALPDLFLQKWGLTRSSVYVQGQNLLTHVFNRKYVGLDPETGSFVLPPLRVLTLGVQFNF